MNKFNLPSLAAVFLLLLFSAACTDSGDDFDHNSLYDTWSMGFFHEDYELNLVTTLEINRDGSYNKTRTFREPEDDVLVGYNYFEEGNFNLNGVNIVFEPVRSLYIGYEEPWGTFEELVEMEVNTASESISSTLEYREGGSKLAIFTPCNDVLLSMCAPTPIYTRVD